MKSLRAWIRDVDWEVWLAVHSRWRNAFFDAVAPFLRNQFFWAPLYLFFAVYMIRNFGKRGIFWCSFFLITFGITDYLNSSVLKPLFHRIRPCNNPLLQDALHLLVPCGGGYSFPSSHAANHFGLAAFVSFTCIRIWPRWGWLVWLWALSIVWAQVYVGVHFPADVVAGGLLGSLLGWGLAQIFNRYADLSRQSAAAPGGQP